VVGRSAGCIVRRAAASAGTVPAPAPGRKRRESPRLLTRACCWRGRAGCVEAFGVRSGRGGGDPPCRGPAAEAQSLGGYPQCRVSGRQCCCCGGGLGSPAPGAGPRSAGIGVVGIRPAPGRPAWAVAAAGSARQRSRAAAPQAWQDCRLDCVGRRRVSKAGPCARYLCRLEGGASPPNTAMKLPGRGRRFAPALRRLDGGQGRLAGTSRALQLMANR
jgi:hypothetical protein